MEAVASFYEFFAGAGMARAGLGDGWTCLFANDFDHKKCVTYERHWLSGTLKEADIGSLTTDDLPGSVDLAWGSFPCQDLSLAGNGAGLRGQRSGTFWAFWRLMTGLVAEGRAPKVIALENVCGALTSHGGRDFAAICQAFCDANYRIGALVVDAALFVPQSRPRLFIIGVQSDTRAGNNVPDGPASPWHTKALRGAFGSLPPDVQQHWIWWNPPEPPNRKCQLSDLIETKPTGVEWHSQEHTQRLLAMMSELNRAKVEAVARTGRRAVGTLYRRTRKNVVGRKVQRAEVRFDDVSGCLRTPAGGSSRQLILVVEGDSVRSRLISSRETARLMGLPDSYQLPENYNEAYHLTGDGVVVPVVRHIAAHIIEPVLGKRPQGKRAAA